MQEREWLGDSRLAFGTLASQGFVKVTIGKGKRPRDPNQLAKWIVDQSTSEVPQPEPVPIPAAPVDLSAYMAAMGRKGGLIGGKRRLKTMTKAARSKVATKAAKARWHKHK
jgi:hypothetical protein